jgi:hypothetical protein
MAEKLGEFTVTSHSATRAVINGPDGGFVVRDGEDSVILGAKWAVTIVPTGVILNSNKQEVVLTFDNSLRPVSSFGSDTSAAPSSSGTVISGVDSMPSSTPPLLPMVNPN